MQMLSRPSDPASSSGVKRGGAPYPNADDFRVHVQRLSWWFALGITIPFGCSRHSSQPTTSVHTDSKAKSTDTVKLHGHVVLVTFDDLAMEQVSKNPSDMRPGRAILSLVGERIRISGYMHPSLKRDSLMQFLLTKANLYGSFFIPRDEVVAVWLHDGKAMNWTRRQVHVEGTLSVDQPAGDTGLVYQLRDAVAIPSRPN